MDTIQAFIEAIEDEAKRKRVDEVLGWIAKSYPQLESAIKWNQPMFIDHGTFIIGFSLAKKHLAVAPEHQAIDQLEDEITGAGYGYTKQLIRIPWEKPVDYALLKALIDFNIQDKAEIDSFWRS